VPLPWIWSTPPPSWARTEEDEEAKAVKRSKEEAIFIVTVVYVEWAERTVNTSRQCTADTLVVDSTTAEGGGPMDTESVGGADRGIQLVKISARNRFDYW